MGPYIGEIYVSSTSEMYEKPIHNTRNGVGIQERVIISFFFAQIHGYMVLHSDNERRESLGTLRI